MSIVQQCEIFGNIFCFEELYKWIENKINNKMTMTTNCSSCLVLVGPPGIGKTYAIEKLCTYMGIVVKRIDSMNCHSTKELDDLLTKISSTNLEDNLRQQDTKKIIFIDEFEVLVGLDRNIPSTLYQRLDYINSKGKSKSMPYIPILIACNTNIEKKLGDIRRECKFIHLNKLDDVDIMLMLRSYAKKNNIDMPSNIILSIAEIAQGNIQQALRMLNYELLQKDKKNTENTENTDNTSIYGIIDKMPDIDVLYNYPTRNIARKIFEEDLWMNPLRFHENLPAEIETRKGVKTKKATVYSEILKTMMEWDIMNTSTTDDAVNDLSLEHLCKAPCYLLGQLERRKNDNQTSMAYFTKTLSQMSLQKKMEKQSYNDNFPWKHIGNYNYTLKKHKDKHTKNKISSIDTDNTI